MVTSRQVTVDGHTVFLSVDGQGPEPYAENGALVDGNPGYVRGCMLINTNNGTVFVNDGETSSSAWRVGIRA